MKTSPCPQTIASGGDSAASDGQPKISRTLLTDHVLALRQQRSKRHAQPGDGAWPGPPP
jgi:hypothetical protein